jgi:ABC-type nitrate/sulfonate/bicarbonate transport system substrate-binding protein
LNLPSFFTLTVCYLLIVPSAARSQSTRITVSYSSDTPANLPAFVAKEVGFFSKNGLDAQLVRIAGTVAVMALIADESPISQVGGSAVIASNLGGSDVVRECLLLSLHCENSVSIPTKM